MFILSIYPPSFGIRAIANKRYIEYLDLELSSQGKKFKTIENNILNCNLESAHKLHSLFSEDPSQNLLIDLVINFAKNLEQANKKINKTLEEVLDHLKTKNLDFKNIKENLDFIKNQNCVILEKISKQETITLTGNFPEITKILDSNKEILQETRKISNKTEELKGIILS